MTTKIHNNMLVSALVDQAEIDAVNAELDDVAADAAAADASQAHNNTQPTIVMNKIIFANQ